MHRHCAHLRDDPLQAMVDLIGERFDLGPAKSASVETTRPDEQGGFLHILIRVDYPVAVHGSQTCQ